MNKRILEIARITEQQTNKFKFNPGRGILYKLCYCKHSDGEEAIYFTPEKLDTVYAPPGNLRNEEIDLLVDWLINHGFGTKLKGESNDGNNYNRNGI